MGVDNTHGGSFYLVDSTGSAIKDLTFELPLSDISKMYFSKNILFRFKDDTTLEVMTNLTGDINTSNVEVKVVNLYQKDIVHILKLLKEIENNKDSLNYKIVYDSWDIAIYYNRKSYKINYFFVAYWYNRCALL